PRNASGVSTLTAAIKSPLAYAAVARVMALAWAGRNWAEQNVKSTRLAATIRNIIGRTVLASDSHTPLSTGSARRVNPQIIGARSYAATQFRSQFFRDVASIGAVADDLGTDE